MKESAPPTRRNIVLTASTPEANKFVRNMIHQVIQAGRRFSGGTAHG